MEAKIVKIIILRKTFFFIVKSFFFTLIIFVSSYSSLYLKIDYIGFLRDKIRILFFSFRFDLISFLFICMVLIVTSLVLLYREFYMEHYNNKKFFYLTIIFLIAILILSSRGSLLNFVVGWDGLGVSSLCLIMFYSNKTTIFNSMITFFFNRVGDVILLIVFCHFLCYPSLRFFLWNDLRMNICFLMLICSFTKRAQFPLSSWLPAAMSAPTPISAIVHSSTLVTAGVFFVIKIYLYMEIYGLSLILGFFSFLTFIVGGFIANLELDTKKVVAFSTIRQISMIIVMLSLGILMISLGHTFIHAIFKTLLFCSCGRIFLFNFSDQSRIRSSVGKRNKRLFFFLFSSVFSMRGLIFSSSFFSKDVVLEYLSRENFTIVFTLFSLGGILTILYGSSLIEIFYKSMKIFSSNYNSSKKFLFIFFMIFCILTIIAPLIIIEVLHCSFYPIVYTWEIQFILILMILPIFFSNYIMKEKLSFFNFEMLFTKYFSFRIFGKTIKIDNFSFSFSEQLFLKPYFSIFSSKLNPSLEIKIWITLSIFFIFLIVFYSISLKMNMVLKLPKSKNDNSLT